ncbi:hypothetical protein Ndes2437B_g02119 [Nannochloris sp. 'desiccata']
MILLPVGQALDKIEPRSRPGENLDSTQSTGDWHQLSETCKKLKAQGFARYHAKRQALFDERVTLMGFFIYQATAYSLYKEQGLSNLAPLLPLIMSIVCIAPIFFHRAFPEAYYKWRDYYFIFHFIFHHVYAPQKLERLGVALKDSLPDIAHPVAFFLGALMSRTIVWQSLNVLMYRLRIKTFLLAQPLILAMVIPFELGICNFLGAAHPNLTKHVYGSIGQYGRLVFATAHPVFLLFDQGRDLTSPPHPVAVCRQVHLFLVIFFGYLLPGIIIWRLEKESWRYFLTLRGEQVVWPGSPEPAQLTQALSVLEEDQRAEAESESSGVRVVVLVLLGAALLWRTLEYMPIVNNSKT